MLKEVIFEWKSVVVGGGLAAVEYAVDHHIPIVRNCGPLIFEFDVFEDNPSYKIDLYEGLLYRHSMEGMCPFSNLVKSVELNDDHLRVKTEQSTCIVKFEEAHIFDLANIDYAPQEVYGKNYLRVFDWLHTNKLIEDKNNLPIYVFEDKRKKGVVWESVLTQDELGLFDNSDTMNRLKLQKVYGDAYKFDFVKREVIEIQETIYLQKGVITFHGRTGL